MNPIDLLRVAVRALWRNKVRSFLTTLGIVIGVGAVIAMVAIGEGAKAQVEQAFSSMGSNLLTVMSGVHRSGGAHGGWGSMPTLTWADLRAIQAEVPTVRYAAPVLRMNAQVMSEDLNWTTSVQGTTSEFFDIRNWGVSRGVPFTQSDVDVGSKVALLGETVVEKLFGAGTDPVGQMVRIRNIPFVVDGVLARKGQSPQGQDNDDVVLVPVSTFRTKLQGSPGNFIGGIIMVSTTSMQDTAKAVKQISGLLRDRHHLQPGQDDDFSVRNLTEVASARAESTQTLTALLVAIAAVSLAVGGIGIMNIMLVSVTERTREIGIRMAVGAKPRAILLQFLVESLSLAVAGGFIGVVAGLAVARWQAATSNWPMLVRPDTILVAVGFSALVGIVFGLYPAWKAARLDPIEALRYE